MTPTGQNAALQLTHPQSLDANLSNVEESSQIKEFQNSLL